MSLFRPLLPASVHVAESIGPIGAESAFAEEDEAVARAIPQRRREFHDGRALARQALSALGIQPEPIRRGPRGAPIWPADVVGSITHTDRYAAAAIARSAQAVSLGIDAQPLALLPPEVVPVVTSSREQARLANVAGDLAALLAFVAKEAVFKAWWPLTARELDFAEVELWPVTDGPAESGELIAELVSDRHPAMPHALPWEVHWRVTDGLLLAAVAVQR